MSKLGLTLSTCKPMAKPQLIQPRSRPHVKSSDISTDCLDRETYRNPPFHIFSDTFSSMGSCSKVLHPQTETKAQFLNSGFKLLTVNHLMDWPSPVIICHLVGMCPHCLQGSHMSATGEVIVSLLLSHYNDTVCTFRAIKLSAVGETTEPFNNPLLFS